MVHAGPRSASARAAATLALLASVVLCAPAHAVIITFDDAGDAISVNTRYSTSGVTFSNPAPTSPVTATVYARSTSANASAPNVVSVFKTGVPAFNAYYGAVDATFTTLQKTVSIDAAALLTPEALGTPYNRPFLEAYDSSDKLLGRVLFAGPLPGAGGISAFQTLTFTSSSANIKKVRFSSQQSQGGPNVYGLFDNLTFQGAAFNYDNFSPKEWTVTKQGKGTTVAEVSQALKVTLAATAIDGPTGAFSAGYLSTCKLKGDFDVMVDFKLSTWPATNGARVGLSVPGATAERVSWGAGDAGPAGEYLASNIGGQPFYTASTSTAGRLRLTRVGSVVTSYFANSGTTGWKSIGTGTMTTGDVQFQISAWSHDAVFADQAVAAVFDNVAVAFGTGGGFTGTACPFP